MQRKDILLFSSEPFVEKKIQYGLVTDASPWPGRDVDQAHDGGHTF
jgi:hypothetical protein